MLKDYANILAAPLTAIFNSSLREGVLPNEWKMANVIPLPKTKPMISVETDIRPISLTPIVAKVFEYIVMGWVDDIVGAVIYDKQFGGVGGTSNLEYACPVWHTNLPKYLSDNIKLIQKRALKSIFPNKGYDDILNDIGMCTLRERRNVICAQYFKNMQGNSHKVHHLLPEERCIHYDKRRENKYPLTQNRTNRYGKSVIPWGLRNWQ